MQELNAAEIKVTSGGSPVVLLGILLAEVAAIEQIDGMVRGLIDGWMV